MLFSQHPKVMVFEEILNYLYESAQTDKVKEKAWQELRLYETMPNEYETNTVYASHLLEAITTKIHSITKTPIYVDSSPRLLYLKVSSEVINNLNDFKKVIHAQIADNNLIKPA